MEGSAVWKAFHGSQDNFGVVLPFQPFKHTCSAAVNIRRPQMLSNTCCCVLNAVLGLVVNLGPLPVSVTCSIAHNKSELVQQHGDKMRHAHAQPVKNAQGPAADACCYGRAGLI
jgi:hypothetical protein